MSHAEYEGARLTVYLGILDTLGQRGPRYFDIIERAREEGLAVSAFQGVQGCGRSGQIAYSHFADTIMNLPVKVEIVDRRARVEAFLPILVRMVGDAPITLEPLRYFAARSYESHPLDDETERGILYDDS